MTERPQRDPFSARPRLSPTMSSRKLQALDFIRRYFAQWGHSPTLSEIGAHLGVSAKRAHDLVRQLAATKAIEHRTGEARGIRMPDRSDELSEAEVLRRLAQMGWRIEAGQALRAPGTPAHMGAAPALTDSGLPPLPDMEQ